MTKFNKGDKVALTGVVVETDDEAPCVRVWIDGAGFDMVWIEEKFLTLIPKTPKDALPGEVWKYGEQYFRKLAQLNSTRYVWENVNRGHGAIPHWQTDANMSTAEYVGTIPGSEAWEKENNG